MQLLTVSQAADTLAVSVKTVRRLIKSGQLRATHVGRAVRIEDGELVAYVRRRRDSDGGVQPLTPGQLRAFHAKCDRVDRELNRESRQTKRLALAHAGRHFEKQFESANDLNELEASWILDRLDDELEAARQRR